MSVMLSETDIDNVERRTPFIEVSEINSGSSYFFKRKYKKTHDQNGANDNCIGRSSMDEGH